MLDRAHWHIDESRAGRAVSGRVFIAACLLLAQGSAIAQQAPVTAVAGAGSRSCAQMQADIRDLPNVRRAYVSWMQGYLSGRNGAREARGDSLVDLADYEAQWEWLVQWCADRADRAFGEAVAALFEERAARSPTQ